MEKELNAIRGSRAKQAEEKQMLLRKLRNATENAEVQEEVLARKKRDLKEAKERAELESKHIRSTFGSQIDQISIKVDKTLSELNLFKNENLGLNNQVALLNQECA